MLCKIWGFHGDDYEECRPLGYKNPVRTSQETHYVSVAESSRLMLCKIWGFHGDDYEECRPLGYKNPVRTSQETHYVSAAESSRLMLCKICCSCLYCLCVMFSCLCVICVTCLLYCCTTATGLKPNCSLTNIYIYIYPFSEWKTLRLSYPSVFEVILAANEGDTRVTHSEDGSDIFLRNVCSLKNHTTVIVYQKTAFFIVTAMKTPSLTLFSSTGGQSSHSTKLRLVSCIFTVIHTAVEVPLLAVLVPVRREVNPLYTKGTQSLLPWRWRRYVSPKRRFLQEPQGVISQKTAFFIITAVETSNLT
jgi:hypothetical protein